jgi:tetratricopeptide (TPR) repeat protein
VKYPGEGLIMSYDIKMISLVGYSLAKDRGQINKGIELCSKAIQIDPVNSDNYLYLGRVYLIAGQRELAIKTFRRGLRIRKDDRVIDELKNLGIRTPPPFSALPRGHTLNIMAGKILKLIHFK